MTVLRTCRRILKLAPVSLPCPQEALLTGRAADPLRNAVAYGPTKSTLDALTSLGGEPMKWGQIVPFQVVIEVGGSRGPERGTIEFTAGWSTHTTSNDEFGYDKNYMVYCAFVDTADPGFLDPNNNARVQSFRSVLVNQGTVDEKIQGTFRVCGLDHGDKVIVEIWVVLHSSMPNRVGGTIAADLVSAEKVISPPVPITIGTQTISIGNLSKIGPMPRPEDQPPQPPLPPVPPQPPALPGATITVVNRTWTATDDCGNRGSCVQQFTLRDTTPPALSIPADMVLEFPADTGTNATGVATATDNCSTFTIEFSDVVTSGCRGSKVIARTWTATDDCGNQASAVQTIAVRDTTAPVITAPPAVTLECPADVSTNNTGVATAQDASSGLAIGYTDTVIPGCGGSKTISRQWVAADPCGNTSKTTQLITLIDTTAPVLNGAPTEFLALQCYASVPPPAPVMASDSCEGLWPSHSMRCRATRAVPAITSSPGPGPPLTLVATPVLAGRSLPSMTQPPPL